MIKRIGLLISICTFASTALFSCASSGQKATDAFERRWVRNTKQAQDIGNDNNMVFHPIVFKDKVVGANNIDGIVAYSKLLGLKKWNFKVQGGVSNPGVAVGSYIFFSTYEGKAIALNADTGKIFWTTDIDYPTSKPFVFDNGRIYIHTQSDEVISLEASSGEREWTFKRPGAQKIQVSSTNAPLILGSLIVSGFSDGSIVALEKSSGRERWNRRLNFQNRFRDLTALTLFDQDKILVGGYDDAVYALNGVDGSVIWKKEISVTSNFVALEEASAKVCASTIDDKIYCLDPAKGETVQEIRTSAVATQLHYQDGKLWYGLSSGGLGVYDFSSARSYVYPTYTGVSALPVLDAQRSDVVYFSTDAGNLYSIKYNF